MKLLIEEKQLGRLSYFVSSIDVLEEILKTAKIAHSRTKELNVNTGNYQYYVSFSRNIMAASDRNNRRWRFGVIVDGDKLSNKYQFDPVSYTGVAFDKSGIRVKELISYDDDTYYLRLVNWKKFEISETMFDKIQSEISNMTDGEKIKSGLTYQSGGKRLINGHRIREKYVFSARYGCLTLTDRKFPEICSMISKLPSVNEYEERVWIKNGFYISIKGCILGIIVPGDMTEDESDFYDMYIQPVIDLLNVETTIFY